MYIVLSYMFKYSIGSIVIQIVFPKVSSCQLSGTVIRRNRPACTPEFRLKNKSGNVWKHDYDMHKCLPGNISSQFQFLSMLLA